jgi:hypothetical protein
MPDSVWLGRLIAARVHSRPYNLDVFGMILKLFWYVCWMCWVCAGDVLNVSGMCWVCARVVLVWRVLAILYGYFCDAELFLD